MTSQANRKTVIAGAATISLIFAGGTFAAIIPIEIPVDGIGMIQAMVPGGTPDAITGSFSVTKKNPDGSTMTLKQLENSLGQDHLNWFQKVTKDGPNPPPPGETVPFIDPPKGGLPINLDPTWADDRPWFYDEVKPNPVPVGRNVDNRLQLSAHSGGMSLSYSDRPSGQQGNTVNFSTFLISDFGNKTYGVLGTGFSWATKVDMNGTGHINDITKDTAFTAEFAKEIQDEFGWQRVIVPEPSCLLLGITVGLLLVVMKYKSGRARKSAGLPTMTT